MSEAVAEKYKTIIGDNNLLLVDQYLDYHDYYSEKYGVKTIVFLQDGKFYESFGRGNRGPNLKEIEEILQTKLTFRGIKTGDPKAPRDNMLGFPVPKLYSSIKALIKNGYNVVIFDEEKRMSEIKKKVVCDRHFVGVFTDGIFIPDDMSSSSYVLCVYIKEEKSIKGGSLMGIGLTLVDILTGESIIHEFYNDQFDEKFGLDELLRIIQGYNPARTIIYYDPVNLQLDTISFIKEYIELNKIPHSFYLYNYDKKISKIDEELKKIEEVIELKDPLHMLKSDMFKINYQNNLFSKIFHLHMQVFLSKKMSPIEVLGIETMPYVTISLIIMINYLGEFEINVLKNLSLPQQYVYNKHLILGNNAIEQLNLIDSNSLQTYDKKIKSLLDVINKTSTPMGKRFLMRNLVNPLSQEQKIELQRRYDIIEALKKDKRYLKITDQLKNIYDLEKMHRKIARGIIKPSELDRMNEFYNIFQKILSIIDSDNELRDLFFKDSNRSLTKLFNVYHKHCNKIFNMKILQKYTNIAEIVESLFVEGYNKEIDKVHQKYKFGLEMLQSTKNKLIELIETNPNYKPKKKKKDSTIKETSDSDVDDGLEIDNTDNTNIIKSNPNDKVNILCDKIMGYYFTMNKTNEKLLKEQLKKKKNIKIEAYGDIMEISTDSFTFKNNKSKTLLSIEDISSHTKTIDKNLSNLRKFTEIEYSKTIFELYSKYADIMKLTVQFISELDFLTNGAYVSDIYYYTKPVLNPVPIEKNDQRPISYIKAKELRHAIIERLCKDTAYIPNDIELGGGFNGNNRNNGIILYGINSCGKSSFIKSIAIAVVLAQIGYYVPAENFEYEPYMALYARLTGNDNMYKGMSSFVLEMTEIDSIITRTKHSGQNTLIIGDEVCRGTNDTEAQILVSSTLVHLSSVNASFIFASHLHGLPHLPEIANLKNLRIFHLLVEYDEKNDALIFNRKIMEGSGPKSYALVVAKYIIKDKKFNNLTEIIRQRLNNEISDIPTKKSNYNKDLIMIECNLCLYKPTKTHHKELETHHIKFQSCCLPDGKIIEQKYLSKDDLHNLVVLCRKCHEKVHKNLIKINGKFDTSIGPILDYEFNYVPHSDSDCNSDINSNKTDKHQNHIPGSIVSTTIKSTTIKSTTIKSTTINPLNSMKSPSHHNR